MTCVRQGGITGTDPCPCPVSAKPPFAAPFGTAVLSPLAGAQTGRVAQVGIGRLLGSSISRLSGEQRFLPDRSEPICCTTHTTLTSVTLPGRTPRAIAGCLLG